MSDGSHRRVSQGSHRRAAAGPWLAAVAILLAGCASSSTPSAAPASAPGATLPSPADSAAPTASDATGSPAAAPVPGSPVAGIVVAVDSAGLGQVKGFTLRTNVGDATVFTFGTLENADEFPPGHLKEHQATAAPILVFFRVEGDQLVVYRIEDAG